MTTALKLALIAAAAVCIFSWLLAWLIAAAVIGLCRQLAGLR